VAGGRPRPTAGAVPEAVAAEQAEVVVRAMLPAARRALGSSNDAVVQASLDSMRRVERMFGRGALDKHLEIFAEAIAKQSSAPGGGSRAGLILQALADLCSPGALADLRRSLLEAT